jgi:putative transposase
MPRRLRCSPGGYVYHVLNRAVGRATLFHKPGDYAAFENVLAEAADERPMRLLAYRLMPNHWHLVLWPDGDHDLPRYLHWLPLTHLRRYHAHYHTTGNGPIYQGRYKSIPVQQTEHFYTVCRYVERNPVRARFAPDAEAWRWSSLGRRAAGVATPWLAEWPLPRPADWVQRVNAPETEAEWEALRGCVRRGRPFGEAEWCQQTAQRLRLGSSLRPVGRPRKESPQP